MSSVKTWLTKEEVLKDLAMVSGGRVARGGNFHEGYLVVGDAPPPAIIESEDDEMLQQFGDAIRNRGTSIQCENAPPDLQGITDLIRLVEGSDEEDDDINNTAQTSKYVIAIRKPSTLNPNVKEFVPNSALYSNSSSNVSESKTEGEVKTEQVQCDTNKLAKDDVADVENIKPNVCEDIATKLKNEISSASKSDSFERKKQKNVAIATLLRYYANSNGNTTPKTPTEKVKEPVKLITPDYFMNRSSPVKELEVMAPESTSTTPIPKSTSSSANSVLSNEVKSEPALNTQGIKDSPVKSKVDPAIKKSIEKVNHWMGEPVERKSPAICIGPIAFKRKEPSVASKSPSKSEADVKKVSTPKPLGQYQPSNYAADLGKKYMERSKKQKQKMNAWTDLDVLLKERDEVVMKKRLQEARASNNNSEYSDN